MIIDTYRQLLLLYEMHEVGSASRSLRCIWTMHCPLEAEQLIMKVISYSAHFYIHQNSILTKKKSLSYRLFKAGRRDIKGSLTGINLAVNIQDNSTVITTFVSTICCIVLQVRVNRDAHHHPR